MSWMDSWSRPGKRATVPPPFYLTQGEDVPYCHSCGRLISTRKSQRKQSQPAKYCSDRCRHHKPGPLDRRIESAIVALLNGNPDSGIEKTSVQSRYTKGDRRNIVTCDEIEKVVFGREQDPSKTFGRRKNRASRALQEVDQDLATINAIPYTEMFQENTDASPVPEQARPLIRPPQTASEVNGSVGGEKGWAERREETSEEQEKRTEGQRHAEEREMVRRAARRGVVFGFEVMSPQTEQSDRKKKNITSSRGSNTFEDSLQTANRRKCEALMNGSVIEPSFAKGNWAIRWREEN